MAHGASTTNGRLGRGGRAALAALWLVVVLVAGVACSSDGDDDASPRQIVYASAAETTDAGSSKIAMTIEVEGAGAQQATIDATGAFDYSSGHGVIPMGLPMENGQAPTEIEMRLLGETMYMRFPSDMAAALGGKTWAKVDLAAAAESAGVDLGSLGSASNADPTQSLAQLRGVSDEVTQVGEETLRGEKVTHYRFTIDPAKAVKEAPAKQREALESSLSRIGNKAIPMEAWIDGDGRVRKMVQTLPVEGVGTTKVTLEMFDFGTDVEVSAPPEADVSDVTSRLGNLGQQQGATGQN